MPEPIADRVERAERAVRRAMLAHREGRILDVQAHHEAAASYLAGLAAELRGSGGRSLLRTVRRVLEDGGTDGARSGLIRILR